MKKFFVLLGFKADAMKDWMTTTDEATRKTQTDQLMQEWNAWMTAHAANIVDKGMPLGKNMRVTANGVESVSNDFNWYLIVQAESQEAAAEMLKDHPNLKTIPTSYMEVMGTEGMAM
jgi:hypothetical protein